MAFLWPILFGGSFHAQNGSLAELMVFGDGLLPAWELALFDDQFEANNFEPGIWPKKKKEGTRMRAIWPQLNFGQSIFGRKMDNSQSGHSRKASQAKGQLAKRMVDLKGRKMDDGQLVERK